MTVGHVNGKIDISRLQYRFLQCRGMAGRDPSHVQQLHEDGSIHGHVAMILIQRIC